MRAHRALPDRQGTVFGQCLTPVINRLAAQSEGMLPISTDLKNPDLDKVAQAMGLWGRTVTDAAERCRSVRIEFTPQGIFGDFTVIPALQR
jgi:hypothetical protein